MSASSASDTTFPVTVVIATLGGDTLSRTIEQLNAGARRPSEILICIPERESPRAAPLAGGNVRVVTTPFRGQVAQRAEGFRQATQPYVLQLDDDMGIDEADIALLIGTLRSLGPGNAVAPIFVDLKSGLGIHRQHGGLTGFLQSLNATVLGGLPWGAGRIGRVSRLGTNFGVDRSQMTAELLQTEWLPGGCLLHYRDSLVTDHFFPYPGKAYGEDLIHSHLLSKNGIRLWVVRDATCRTDDFVIPVDLKGIINEARARIYFNRLRGQTSWLFWVWIAISVAVRQVRHVARRLRSNG